MASFALNRKKLNKGDFLFKEDEPGTEAYLVKHGYVSIWKIENGTRINLATRAEGEIIGEMALIDDTTRSASVTAESAVEVEIITKQQLEAMLTEYNGPQNLHHMLRWYFGGTNERTEEA